MLIRALLWAYRGLDELTDAHVMSSHSALHALEQSDYLQLPPRSAGTELRSHASQTPPIGKNLSDSVREVSPKIGTFPRKVH